MSLLRLLPLAAIAALLFSVSGQVATAMDEASDNATPDVEAVELPSDEALTAESVAEEEMLDADAGSEVEANASVDEPAESETVGETGDKEAIEVADESAGETADGEGLDTPGDDVVGDAEAGESDNMTADMSDEAASDEIATDEAGMDELGDDLTDSVGDASSDAVDGVLTDESVSDPVDEALTNQTDVPVDAADVIDGE